MTYNPLVGTARIDVGQLRVRKKAVEVEAMQFDGRNYRTVLLWIGEDRAVAGVQDGADLDAPPTAIFIHTLEGDMRADVDDWIIRGVKGEFYPCKPDIFDATYEVVDAAAG